MPFASVPDKRAREIMVPPLLIQYGHYLKGLASATKDSFRRLLLFRERQRADDREQQNPSHN
jgi:hypothetical protein